jgi:hypothetical protein
MRTTGYRQILALRLPRRRPGCVSRGDRVAKIPESCGVSETDAAADEQEAATDTAARAVVDHLRDNDLYGEAGERADEIVELSHGHTWFNGDDPGGESRQHGIAF